MRVIGGSFIPCATWHILLHPSRSSAALHPVQNQSLLRHSRDDQERDVPQTTVPSHSGCQKNAADRRCRQLRAQAGCTEKSRRPSIDIASVRGMGVAVSVRTSTSARIDFRVSFWRTPKRCSSSMMTRPRRLNLFRALERSGNRFVFVLTNLRGGGAEKAILKVRQQYPPQHKSAPCPGHRQSTAREPGLGLPCGLGRQ